MTLPPIPTALVPTRDTLHQVAYFVLSPARHRRTGRMGLVPIPGGFGTPPLDGRVVGVREGRLVDEGPDADRSAPLTTLADAAAFFGEPYEENWFDGFGDPLPPFPADRELFVSPEAAWFIGEMFDLGARVIDAFAWEVPGGITETWIWPEHFDIATEAGDEVSGGKASFGLSPGDGPHDDPYFYVSAWGEIDRGDPFWNDDAFNGASLAYAAVRPTEDPVGRVVEFFMEGFRRLNP